MSELDFKALELKINQLISTCDTLKKQNRQLQEEIQVIRAERAVISEQKEMARTKVEAMITRLKAMEH